MTSTQATADIVADVPSTATKEARKVETSYRKGYFHGALEAYRLMNRARSREEKEDILNYIFLDLLDWQLSFASEQPNDSPFPPVYVKGT